MIHLLYHDFMNNILFLNLTTAQSFSPFEKGTLLMLMSRVEGE